MDAAALFWLSFLAGIYASIGSPCALILYPGYLSFLAGRSGDSPRLPWPFIFGTAVAAGVITGMLACGVLFILILAIAGDAGRTAISIGAFILLLVLSLLLILDIGYGHLVRPALLPGTKRPLFTAYLLGLGFGIIILPCNAAPVAVLFALASSASGFVEGLGSFLWFGLGITFPLLVLAGLSQARSRQIMAFLTGHRRAIRLIAGLVMLAISAVYLFLLLFPGSFSR
jgi:cytochrome c-type biogenesis protein